MILEDEVCLRVLFQLSYILMSFHFSFFSLKAYEELLKDYVLEIAKNPTSENIKRELKFVSIAESITKNLDLGRSRSGEFDSVFREVFKLARDPIESEKRKNRVNALNVLYDGGVILPKKKRKICHGDTVKEKHVASSLRAVISLASIDEFPAKESANMAEMQDMGTSVPNIDQLILEGLDMVERNSRQYTAQTLEILKGTLSEIKDISQLQESESEPDLTKLNWVLRIMKHMEFKDHVFSFSNESIIPELAETEVKKDGASLFKILPKNLDKCDPGPIFKLMTRKCMIQHSKQILTYLPSQLAEVEFHELINSVSDSLKQLKNEMQLKWKEYSGKIEFCMMVYEGTEVEEKLSIFYEKRAQILLDLGLDLKFCRNFCSSLSAEVAIKFENLLDELVVVKLNE